jgi:hypothetical protein
MRTSGNPIKESSAETPQFKRHRLIMPVYIPNDEGYYQDAFKIFTICIESLLATIHPSRMDITIIDNASIPKVREYLEPKLESGQIDQYIGNAVNRGKADAIIGQAKASYESLITIADADVLFLPGWLDAIESIYHSFPDTGVVCPFPTPNLAHFHCTSTWINNWFSIHRGQIVPPVELLDLEQKIGAKIFSEKDLKVQRYAVRNGCKAIIGAGHFVATYRGDVFASLPYQAQRRGLKGGLRQIESHVDRLGLSRLSDLKTSVMHMGNKYEEWMQVRQSERARAASEFAPLPPPAKSQIPVLIRRLLKPLIAGWDKSRFR